MKYTLIFLFFLIIILSLRYLYMFMTLMPYQAGQKVLFEHTLFDEPKVNRFVQIFYVNNIAVKARITKEEDRLHYADTIKIRGVIEKEKTKKGNLILENPSIEKVESGSLTFLTLLFSIRKNISETFSTYLNKDESELLLGIVFGIRNTMDRQFYEGLRNTGVLHVVAASGMNVSMVAGVLQGVFVLFLRRQFALVCTIGGIIFYALLSGFEPSIIRASLMAIFAYAAAILGRQSHSYLSLSLAAFVMLMINPLLIQDIGFQLSFFSTFGILSVKPVFDSLLHRVRRFGIMDDFSTTLSAQVASLPILMTSFGSYSLVSILVNVLVLWTIPFVMVLGGIAALCSLFSSSLAAIFLYLCYPFLLFFKTIVIFFSSLSSSSQIKILDIPIVIVIGYYFMLISLVIFVSRRKNPKIQGFNRTDEK